MHNAELVFLIAVVILGVLVILQVVPASKSWKYLLWIVLLCVFGPVIYGIAKTKSIEFLLARHPWWMYILIFFGAIFALRVVLNIVFPGRRR